MDTSSDKDTIPHTIEKNIRGNITSFNDDKNRYDIKSKKLDI